jgi:hypothetical protein
MGTLHSITLKNSAIHWINNAMDRKNINRGFKKLRVWPPARRAYAPEGKTPFHFMFRRVIYSPIFLGNWNQLQHLFEKTGKDASIAASLLRPG